MPRVSAQYKDDQRNQILDAARRCFIREGFHRTTMQDIVAEAGRSAGAIYGYFPRKDDIIEAIAIQNLDAVRNALHDVLTRSPGIEAGEAIAALMESVAAKHAEDGIAAIALMVWSEALRDPALAEQLRRATAAAADELAVHIAALPASKSRRRTPLIGEVYVGMLPGFLLQLALSNPGAINQYPKTVRSLWPAQA